MDAATTYPPETLPASGVPNALANVLGISESRTRCNPKILLNIVGLPKCLLERGTEELRRCATKVLDGVCRKTKESEQIVIYSLS